MQLSKEFLFSFYDFVRKKGMIDEEIVKKIEEILPNTSEKVKETIKKGITKYIYKPSNRVIWTASGTETEYMIYPKLYCTCKFFYKKVVIDKEKMGCKHILSQIICEALNEYKVVELKDNEFINRINDSSLEF